MTFSKLRRHIVTSLWFVPVLGVIAGAVLSFGTLALDRLFGYELIPRELTGGPAGAVAILSTVAASMVSLAALVLTITMVVVQLAMGQFSPRIVQRILQDKPSQIAIGLFVGTFVHAILALREIGAVDDDTVPGLALVTAFALVLVCVAVLVVYVHHIGQSLRVSSLIELVGNDTRKLLDSVYPDRGSPPPEDGSGVRIIHAPKSGVVSVLEHQHLVALASRTDCTLELIPALGEFVPSGAPLLRVREEQTRLDADEALAGVVLGLERTLEQDVAYGIRMLVDIGERSLADSPFQDPTTAVQALDRIHDCLRQLIRRPFSDGIYRDAAGEERLKVPVMSWEAYVHLAFDEIRMAGSGSPQVTRRLKAALTDLKSIAPPNRMKVLDEQWELLKAGTAAGVELDGDRRAALRADSLGMGTVVEAQR